MGTIGTPPCYKYIASNITSKEDRYSFSKHFFSKLVSTGAELDDCLVLYSAFDMPSSAGGRYTFEDSELDPQEYYERIMSLDSVTVLSCPQYYRSVLKSGTQNNPCQLCELSKSYRNANFDVECALFKYLSTSLKNFNSFSALGVNGVFKYCVDIVSELSSDKPAIVPILSIAYSVIRNQTDEFYSYDDLKKRLSSLVGKIAVEAAKSNPNVKEVQMKNHKVLPISWSIVIESIVSAKDLNYDEVCVEVSKIDLSSGKRKRSKKKDKPLVVESPLFDYLDAMADSDASKSETGDKPLDTASEIPIDSVSVDEPVEPEVAMHSDFPETAAPDDADIPSSAYSIEVDDSDIPASAMSSYVENSSASESDTQDEDNPEGTAPPVYDSAPSVPSVDSGTSSDSASETEQGSPEQTGVSEPQTTAAPAQAEQTIENKKVAKYVVPPISEDELIFNIVVRKDALKAYASLYTDFATEIFNALQKSKRLPVEAVFDESGSVYLFMFVRSLGRYFYCPINKDMPNTLVAALLSKSIIKICYQPYFIYSLLRLFDIRVCGVYSICSVDMLLHPEAIISLYKDFFRIYDEHFKNVPSADTGFPEYDSLLVNMQKYILIHAIQTRGEIDKDAYAKSHARDEVLGSSFLRIINLTGNDYLFQLDGNGRVIYNPNYEQKARHDGFFLTYSVNKEDIGDIVLSDLYLDALYELSSKGRFRKYNIQLITISATAMVIFVGESEYELITTALQRYFNRYAQHNHLEKFELTVSHERAYCKTQKGAKRYQTPKNYEQAMDMLITTNDSVSVKASHVVKRKKAKRQAQKQKFDPNK